MVFADRKDPFLTNPTVPKPQLVTDNLKNEDFHNIFIMHNSYRYLAFSDFKNVFFIKIGRCPFSKIVFLYQTHHIFRYRPGGPSVKSQPDFFSTPTA